MSTMYKNNGGKTSTQHYRVNNAPSSPDGVARNHLVQTKMCLRCDKPIYGQRTGTRTIHEACKLPEDRKRGTKVSKPLERDAQRSHPLLVVTKALTLNEVMHQYVASVYVECKGNPTSTRRTLGISIHALRACIIRIERGTISECDALRVGRVYKGQEP